jgi:hypothetical protein
MSKGTDEYIQQAEGELAAPFPPFDPTAKVEELAARKDAIALATLDALQSIAGAILALVKKR